MTGNPDLFFGWARCAVDEGMEVMPDFVRQGVHPECKMPETTWAQLLKLEKQRRDATAAEEGRIMALMNQHAISLAWGDI